MINETTPASSLTDKEREAIAQMPYEEARDQLIQAVQALEAGGLNLDQSMRQWELGEARQSGLKISKTANISFLHDCAPRTSCSAQSCRNFGFLHFGTTLVRMVCRMKIRCLSSSVDRALLS